MENQVETFNQSKIEICKPNFISPKIELDYYLKRVPGQRNRWYFEVIDQEILTYLGTTSMLQYYMPTPEPIIRWMCGFKNYEDAKIALEVEARYGTFLHRVFGMILMNNKFSLYADDILVEIQKFAEFEEFNIKDVPVQQWISHCRQDIVGFFHWKKDYNIKPLAIEITMRSKVLKLAGTMDLICEATLPVLKNGKKVKDEFQTEIILVDFKKNRKAFYSSWYLQQMIYKVIIKENFPQLDLRCFLYGCNNYRLPLSTKATPYRFKEIVQDEKFKLKHYVKMYLEDETMHPKFKIIFKDMILDNKSNLDDIYVKFNIEEYQKSIGKKEE